MKNKNLIIYTSVITLITAITLFIPYQDLSIIKLLRIVFGSIFILFLPGYILTMTFFDEKEIDFLERFALSFALSISVVPLLSFYFNLIGIRINEVSVFLITLFVIVINLVYITFFKDKKLGILK
ncbi:MAG: DUF1616 domain-containing protein [Candidatus Gracilibacteria bacterium]|nr:DUF1616 domain-containing protein [Candidatus Gracilibacteria bacterium]